MKMKKAVVSFPKYLFWVVQIHYLSVAVVAYTSGAGGRPLNRRAIAGLWKLSRLVPPPAISATSARPMKEFTVYPKKIIKPKPNDDDTKKFPELLLMLSEDGSFQRHDYYQDENDDDDDDDDDDNEKDDINQSWGDFITYQKNLDPSWRNLMKGTWDFRDGELILAADRPDENNVENKSDHFDDHNKKNKDSEGNNDNKQKKKKKQQDTVLVGEVVATTTTEEQIQQQQKEQKEHHQQQQQQQQKQQQGNEPRTIQDIRLLVPKGSVQVGKFMYPKRHPSFFDQPMYQPKSKGKFQLRQVLGTLSQEKEEIIVEKFKNTQFYNKRFLLSSHPLKQKRAKRKGNMRWSNQENKFVDDSKNKDEEDEINNQLVPIRVMEVMFYSNNTFTTLAGVGNSVILRGKFDVIGKEKDQIWMQVRRFGFGRSVSGSTFSEGIGLSSEDDKTYWGKISYEDEDEEATGETKATKPTSSSSNLANDREDKNQEKEQRRIQAKGSVMFGWGCEPTSVARFIMREASNDYYDESTSSLLSNDDDDDDDDNDDDDDDDDDDIDIDNDNDNDFMDKISDIEISYDNDDDEIDWSTSFQ